MKTLHKYILGFVLSIALTLVAFGMLYLYEYTGNIFPSPRVAAPILIFLAIGQLLVQLMLFLHMGEEKKPRWNLAALIFALIIVAIVVGGSLWIMTHLNHEQMSHTDMFVEENIFPSDHE